MILGSKRTSVQETISFPRADTGRIITYLSCISAHKKVLLPSQGTEGLGGTTLFNHMTWFSLIPYNAGHAAFSHRSSKAGSRNSSTGAFHHILLSVRSEISVLSLFITYIMLYFMPYLFICQAILDSEMDNNIQTISVCFGHGVLNTYYNFSKSHITQDIPLLF